MPLVIPVHLALARAVATGCPVRREIAVIDNIVRYAA